MVAKQYRPPVDSLQTFKDKVSQMKEVITQNAQQSFLRHKQELHLQHQQLKESYGSQQ